MNKKSDEERQKLTEFEVHSKQLKKELKIFNRRARNENMTRKEEKGIYQAIDEKISRLLEITIAL
jgi:hypothetical protein